MRTCSVEGCNNKHYGRGYCSKHLARVKAHGDPNYEKPEAAWKKPCSVCGGIVGKHGCRGMCAKCARKEWGARTNYSEKCSLERLERRKQTRFGEAINHPLYRVWNAMKDRCRNPNNKAYANYGARGIKVCDRWLYKRGFWNFVDDMGDRPSKEHSLDRIDPNSDYCPENCRWANRHTRNTNYRKTAGKEHNVYRAKNHGVVQDDTWQVTLKKDGKRYYKRFKDINEAREWRDKKIEELWGKD